MGMAWPQFSSNFHFSVIPRKLPASSVDQLSTRVPYIDIGSPGQACYPGRIGRVPNRMLRLMKTSKASCY